MSFSEEEEWWFSELRALGRQVDKDVERRLAGLSKRIMKAIDQGDGLKKKPCRKRTNFKNLPEQMP